MKLTTTFNELRKAGACRDGYRKLAEHLGGVAKYGKARPLNIITILDSNGLDDCLWVINTMADKKTRVYVSAKFAESVLPIFEKKYPNDKRPRDCIDACFDFCNDKIGQRELNAAESATRAAARGAWSAGAATWSVGSTARAAARAAESAGAAAGAAARFAAEYAESAARVAGFAAGFAAESAAERRKQEKIIREFFN